MPDIVRQPGARLTGQVDPRLAKRFFPGPLANLRRSFGAFHAFDKTHTVALVEAGLIPCEAARAILSGLREMEAQGIETARDSMLAASVATARRAARICASTSAGAGEPSTTCRFSTDSRGSTADRIARRGSTSPVRRAPG